MFFDLPAEVQGACEVVLNSKIRSAEHIGGGDINEARHIKTDNGDYFLKMNTGPQAKRMFETEQKGLRLLASANAVRIPKVIAVVSAGQHAGLLMEHIEMGYRAPGFWESFGTALAELHRQSAPQFGLDHDNFIGSLPQPNGRHDTWISFYIHERLRAQIEMAKAGNQFNSSDLSGFEKLFQKLPNLLPAESPSLIHGDLWSGNFLVGAESEPVLIDPAVAYAHREMDLAMSRLFGGFDRPFYRAYEEAWPLEPGFEKRLSLYQLYYLLVHVNLFGGGYVRSVQNILREFV